ncbi:MAG TPA: thioredoxin domain-containing protein [Candidatus Limnocylindrales bacterium]|nr:thioredoxin domain-containing protein [Candidatus Limnocylindrales bacterium]
MSAGMMELSKENFHEEVMNSDLPVMVDFWGPKCVPCLALMPEVEKLMGEYENKVKFYKLNAAENRRLCIELKVMALPTFLFYKAGALVDQLTGGDVTRENIVAKLESLV